MAESTKRSRQSLGLFMGGPEGPMDARTGSQYFQQAIDYFRDKVNVKGDAWDSLWQGQHATAFTVAGAMKDDLLCDLRQSVDKAISLGMSLAEFRDEFKDIVTKQGWTGFRGEGSEAGMAWRTKVIYDTNVRQAYNAGRWQQLQQFPVWVYHHGDSRNPRPLHLSWNGLTLSKDDPWWRTHFPQNGWGCKCRVEGYSKIRARLKGIEIGEAPDDGTYEFVNKKTGEVMQVPKGIDPGFDYSVGEAKFGRRLAQEEFAQWQGEKGRAWQSLTKGNWLSTKRPERLTARELPQPLQQPVDQADAIKAVQSALGADEVLISTPVGTVLVDASVLGAHIEVERTAYLPLLMDALTNPQEIWQSFSSIKEPAR
ncbi:phage minor head protein [Aeromonas veronii]|uniref:phage minor head protein n=1 Tax=Aeromonas veronii TaxID=654 RepID=UPI003F79281A